MVQRQKEFSLKLFSILIRISALTTVFASQPPHQSRECLKAFDDCENSTDCVHRLAVLQSAWLDHIYIAYLDYHS